MKTRGLLYDLLTLPPVLVISFCGWAALLTGAELTFTPSFSASARPVTNEQIVSSVLSDSRIYTVAPTGSMKPTFDETWLILVQKQPFTALRIGDIILYRCAAYVETDGKTYSLIVHRVVGVTSGRSAVVCKGDSNSVSDPRLITESMYEGTVVGLVKKPRPNP